MLRPLSLGSTRSERDEQVCQLWCICFAVAASLEPCRSELGEEQSSGMCTPAASCVIRWSPAKCQNGNFARPRFLTTSVASSQWFATSNFPPADPKQPDVCPVSV